MADKKKLVKILTKLANPRIWAEDNRKVHGYNCVICYGFGISAAMVTHDPDCPIGLLKEAVRKIDPSQAYLDDMHKLQAWRAAGKNWNRKPRSRSM